VYQKVYRLWLTALGRTHVIRERPVRSRSRVRFRPKTGPSERQYKLQETRQPGADEARPISETGELQWFQIPRCGWLIT
jgi:hypothetical protein